MPHAGHGGGRWGTRDGGWTLHLHMGGMGGEERRVDCKPAHGGDGGQGTEGGLYTCTWLGADCGCDVSLACSELVCACWVAVASMAAILCGDGNESEDTCDCGGGALIMFNGVIYTSCMTCPYLLLTKDVVQG